MYESEHGEPWAEKHREILSRFGVKIPFELYAGRLVTCVNACAGFDRPELLLELVELVKEEAIGTGGFTDRVKQLVAQIEGL